jgi:photosystem II stability/assembly factor-like uncharacterized protein
MIRSWARLIGPALVVIAAAGCGAGNSNTSPHASSTTAKSYVKLVAGGITVTPSSGLQNGQAVRVAVKGFPPNHKFFLSECLTPAEVNHIGCGAQLAAQQFGLTDGNGAGSTSFTVQAAASTGPLSPTLQPCAGTCVIVATSGLNGNLSFAPIHFGPPAIASLGSVMCTSPQTCVATGTTTAGTLASAIAATSSDGGSSWTTTLLLGGMVGPGAVSCGSVQSCVIVGGIPVGNNTREMIEQSSDGGRTWTASSDQPGSVGGLRDVSCPSTGYCIAVGASPDGAAGAALVTTSNSGWSSVPLPSGQKSLVLVACVASSHCVAVGGPPSDTQSTVLTTMDGGTTWTRSTLPQHPSPSVGPVTAQDISCPSTTRCIVVGSEIPGDGSPSGRVFITDDGGIHWIPQALPSRTTSLLGISCPTTTECVAVGGGIPPRGGPGAGMILTSTDGGVDWSVRPVPSDISGLNGVSCPTPDVCVATGYGSSGPMVARTSDAGVAWTSSTP